MAESFVLLARVDQNPSREQSRDFFCALAANQPRHPLLTSRARPDRPLRRVWRVAPKRMYGISYKKKALDPPGMDVKHLRQKRRWDGKKIHIL